MKINNDKPVTGVDRGSTPATESTTAPARPDRVSLEQSQNAAALAESSRSSASAARATRLRHIEDAVRSGSYKPNPSRVADDILAAAELEARLRAMMGG